jgi:hypothetical protein
MSVQCPLPGRKQTSRREAATSVLTITNQWDVTRDTRPQGTEQGRALNLRFATWTYVLSNPCPLEWASLSFRRRR